jgi:4-hydroxy-3-polyprenylbenzoate decarboxylase
VKRIIVALTGASGMAYALRLLQLLQQQQTEIHLIASPQAADNLQRELDLQFDPANPASLGLRPQGVFCYRPDDLAAPPASGSARFDGMVIVPCSVGRLGRLAAGTAEDLISRAADVCLKERRPLVLVVRETPLSAIHLRNMLTLTEAGAVVLPACPSFYHRPQSVEELVDTVVERALDHLGLPRSEARRWGG